MPQIRGKFTIGSNERGIAACVRSVRTCRFTVRSRLKRPKRRITKETSLKLMYELTNAAVDYDRLFPSFHFGSSRTPRININIRARYAAFQGKTEEEG